MATMNQISDHQKWLDGLKAGDAVGVYELRGTRLVYTDKVSRRTPSGRLVLEHGETYRPDGFSYAERGSVYAERRLKPIPQP